jgi:hypothetical protein
VCQLQLTVGRRSDVHELDSGVETPRPRLANQEPLAAMTISPARHYVEYSYDEGRQGVWSIRAALTR